MSGKVRLTDGTLVAFPDRPETDDVWEPGEATLADVCLCDCGCGRPACIWFRGLAWTLSCFSARISDGPVP